MSRGVIQRTEMIGAVLDFGSVAIDLSDYSTTGLRVGVVGTSGMGKTNAGLLIGEQLAEQGWVSVLIDPEGEIESMYGKAVSGVDQLEKRLTKRDDKFIVVAAENATEFIPYGQKILEVVDAHRKPVFLLIDEGQVFSAPRRRKGDIGEAADIVNQFSERGRKRALDVFITATRFAGTLHRSVFGGMNLSLIGRQEDPTTWASLAPKFKASRIGYSDLAALEPGEFMCFSFTGVERVRMPMATELARVAKKAKPVKPKLPGTYSQWDRAMRDLPTARLRALSEPVVGLLGAVAGLSAQQMVSGNRALADELEGR